MLSGTTTKLIIGLLGEKEEVGQKPRSKNGPVLKRRKYVSTVLTNLHYFSSSLLPVKSFRDWKSLGFWGCFFLMTLGNVLVLACPTRHASPL